MKRLFVGNLPYRASEGELQDWFSQSGIAVDNIAFIRDRASGEPRGFGFVDVNSDDDAERAIQSCNGKDFQGRTLVVNEARPNPAANRSRAAAGWGDGARNPAPRSAGRAW